MPSLYDSRDISVPLSALLIILLIIVSLKPKTYEFLSVDATEQVRGLAILAIIASHYMTRVFVPGTTHYYWILKDAGGTGVGAFLLISGFGLMSSYMKKGFQKGHLFKRIMRILLPYWIFVFLWIFLDMILLHMTHTPVQILEALGGIVILGDTAKDVNTAMWFVTYILFLSISFYAIFSLKIKQYLKILFIFAISGSGMLISKYIAARHNYQGLIQWGDYSLYFPVGVLTASYYDKWKILFQNLSKNKSIFLYGFLFLLALLYGQYWFVFTVMLLFIPVWYLSAKGKISRFLMFLGTISYELYLVHVPFIVKYDFLLYRQPHWIWFFIFLGIMILIAFVVQQLISKRLYSLIFNQ